MRLRVPAAVVASLLATSPGGEGDTLGDVRLYD